jgi:AraC-like DNA-binding protein
MKLDAADPAHIAELREKGWSYTRLAQKFGVSEGAIHYHCMAQGAVSPRTSPGRKGPAEVVGSNGVRQRRFSEAEDAEILRLRGEGATISAIARSLGRANTSVRVRAMTLELRADGYASAA